MPYIQSGGDKYPTVMVPSTLTTYVARVMDCSMKGIYKARGYLAEGHGRVIHRNWRHDVMDALPGWHQRCISAPQELLGIYLSVRQNDSNGSACHRMDGSPQTQEKAR